MKRYNLTLLICTLLFSFASNSSELYPIEINSRTDFVNTFYTSDSSNKDFDIIDIERDYSAWLTTDLITVKRRARNKIYYPRYKKYQYITINQKSMIKSTSDDSAYWRTLHSVESKQGAHIFRPRNRTKSCSRTRGPCGHHQLTEQALRDIGCGTQQCKKDRENYSKSLKMSKKLLRLNERRLHMNNLPDYMKYLIHQQGAAGIRAIIAASQGKQHLSRRIKRNMANNSPFSYSKLRKLGSKNAAKAFLKFWKTKWAKERRLVSMDSRLAFTHTN